MEAGALEVLRHKDSSMVKALEAVKNENADGIISCGATGAFLSAATLMLKKIPGILRPALVTAFPNLKKGNFVTCLDVGASNVNTPQEMLQFAYMGTLYSQAVYGIEKPVVKLLANGSEEGKGSPEGKEAYQLLKDDPKIKFEGNIEGNAILMGEADVVVSDGFTGNVMLKTTEGVAKGMGKLIKKAFKKNLFTKIGYLFAKGGVKDIKMVMDPKRVGGAMLLGVNGACVKAHGNSDAYSFESAMEVLYRLVEKEVCKAMAKGFKKKDE